MHLLLVCATKKYCNFYILNPKKRFIKRQNQLYMEIKDCAENSGDAFIHDKVVILWVVFKSSSSFQKVFYCVTARFYKMNFVNFNISRFLKSVMQI